MRDIPDAPWIGYPKDYWDDDEEDEFFDEEEDEYGEDCS
jgi:hypothetical protein